jgi:phosphatidate phosphatase APP1
MARGVERRVEDVRGRVLGDRHARQVIVYRGYGTAEEVLVTGRVLSDRPVASAAEADAWWRNLGSALRHLETTEVPGARVQLSLPGAVHTAVTDDEGYFRAWLHPHALPVLQQLWHDVQARVLEPLHPRSPHVHTTARIMVPRPDAQLGIISDIDDTVIVTDATRLLSMLRRTLLENARTRLPFPGVAQFYAGLHGGTGGVAGNPVFYVSSSPWNLYPVLVDFLDHQGIPAGPLLLKDWGISERGILPTRHAAHKLGAIRQVMDCYPRLPFILIGDSGQEDPEIYRDIVHEYGRRIPAVYIRNVSPGVGRAAAVQALAQEVRAAGSELLLADDTLACARHAADRGWIEATAVEAVAAAATVA